MPAPLKPQTKREKKAETAPPVITASLEIRSRSDLARHPNFVSWMEQGLAQRIEVDGSSVNFMEAFWRALEGELVDTAPTLAMQIEHVVHIEQGFQTALNRVKMALRDPLARKQPKLMRPLRADYGEKETEN